MAAFLGYSAIVAAMIGLFLISHKRRSGFAVTLVAEWLWLMRAISINSPDLFIASLIYGALAVYGWCQWGKK